MKSSMWDNIASWQTIHRNLVAHIGNASHNPINADFKTPIFYFIARINSCSIMLQTLIIYGLIAILLFMPLGFVLSEKFPEIIILTAKVDWVSYIRFGRTFSSLYHKTLKIILYRILHRLIRWNCAISVGLCLSHSSLEPWFLRKGSH